MNVLSLPIGTMFRRKENQVTLEGFGLRQYGFKDENGCYGLNLHLRKRDWGGDLEVFSLGSRGEPFVVGTKESMEKKLAALNKDRTPEEIEQYPIRIVPRWFWCFEESQSWKNIPETKDFPDMMGD